MKKRQPVMYANANSPVGAVVVKTADEIMADLRIENRKLRALLVECFDCYKNDWMSEEQRQRFEAAGRGDVLVVRAGHTQTACPSDYTDATVNKRAEVNK